MYARVTTLGIKPEHIAESDALSTEITPEVMAIPGVKHFFRGGDAEGNNVVIAIYESREAAESASDTVKGMFGRFAPFMSSPPDAAEYEIHDHGSNS